MTKKVQCIYYSAGGTTKALFDRIAEGTGYEVIPAFNIADVKARKSFDGATEADLLLIGSAVYEGSVPFIAMEPILKLNGEGKWAAAIGVYGNRSPEDYVSELSGLLREKGFKIIAGAEFVAQHSYAHEAAPAASGRPDEADLDVAYGLGEKIAEKMAAPSEAGIESKPLKFGSKYLNRSEWVGERLKMMIRGPVYDVEKCIQCNKCVEICPVEAVDDAYATDDDLCLKCMACVKACPSAAKTVSYPPQVAQFMNSWGAERKEPKLIL